MKKSCDGTLAIAFLRRVVLGVSFASIIRSGEKTIPACVHRPPVKVAIHSSRPLLTATAPAARSRLFMRQRVPSVAFACKSPATIAMASVVMGRQQLTVVGLGARRLAWWPSWAWSRLLPAWRVFHVLLSDGSVQTARRPDDNAHPGASRPFERRLVSIGLARVPPAVLFPMVRRGLQNVPGGVPSRFGIQILSPRPVSSLPSAWTSGPSPIADEPICTPEAAVVTTAGVCDGREARTTSPPCRRRQERGHETAPGPPSLTARGSCSRRSSRDRWSARTAATGPVRPAHGT